MSPAAAAIDDLHLKPQAPRLSIVIPSLDGHRDGYVPALLQSIASQTFTDYEVHLVKGVSPQGKAINLGAARARGDFLVILDDDARLADAEVLGRLVATLEQDSRIGMAGASIVPDPLWNPFQRRAATQFPRLCTPEVGEITDSDMACHGCCAFPLRVFREVGGEREDILRGLDPDLRVRLRAAGYRVVLAPDCRIHHPLPPNWKALLRTYYRNGYGSAYAMRFAPDSVYETHESLQEGGFQPRTSLHFRVARFPLRLLKAALLGQFMRLAAYTAYAAGYLRACISARPIA
jgi:GT2 family glycosyltransferase